MRLLAVFKVLVLSEENRFATKNCTIEKLRISIFRNTKNIIFAQNVEKYFFFAQIDNYVKHPELSVFL